MGFLQDLFGGNVGNLWHDITADPVAEIGLGTGAALLTGGLLAPELLGAGAAGGLGSLFGTEAAADTGLAASALGGAATGGAETGLDLSGGLLAGGTAAGTDLSASLGDVAIPDNATFTSGSAIPGVNAPAVAPTAAPATSTDLASSLIGGDTSGLATGGDVAVSPDASGSLFDKLVTGATNQITKNPIGLAAGTAGLGLSLLKGNKQSPQEQQLAWEGAVTQQQGNQLQSYTTTGTLPAAQQAQLDAQIQAAKARIIQNHATQGRSTDPSQNSALAQELNNVDMQALALKGQIEQQLFQQGTQDLQLSQEMLTTVANFDRADQKAIGDALMNFAKAMAPAGPSVNLNSLLPKLG